MEKGLERYPEEKADAALSTSFALPAFRGLFLFLRPSAIPTYQPYQKATTESGNSEVLPERGGVLARSHPMPVASLEEVPAARLLRFKARPSAPAR